MPVWLIVVIALAVLAFWLLLAFVLAIVVGGAFRAGIRSARIEPEPDADSPESTVDDHRTVT